MWNKLLSLDSRILYVLVFLALIVPVVRPIGMPISINKVHTLPAYEFVEGLPADSLVIFDIAFGANTLTENQPMVEATLHQLFDKNVKVVIMGQIRTAWPILTPVFESIGDEHGKVYGEDYVIVGFKEGGVATIRRMIDDYWEGAIGIDQYGTRFEELPIMDRLPELTGQYVDLIICYESGSPGFETWYKYTPEIPLIKMCVSAEISSSAKFVDSGQIEGLVGGMRGAAEYEKLVDRPGQATQLMDAQSLSHAIILLMILLGNIAFFATKKEGK